MFDRLTSEREGTWVLSALRRRWWLVAVVGVIAAVVAYVLSSQQTKKYAATSALLFLNQPLDQELLNKQVVSSVDPTRQAATNQSLVELPTVSRLVAASLNLPVARVQSEISFGSDATSDVMKVTATDRSPALAARIANAYTRQYIAFRKTAAITQLNTTERLLSAKLAALPRAQQTGPVGQSLAVDRNELDVLRSAQTGNAQVVLTATPPRSPSSPKPARDAALGLLLGLLVGGALALVLERRDWRIRNVEEVEEIYGVPVIGTIPDSRALRRDPVAAARDEEAFLMLRAQLRYFDVARQLKRVLIASADTGEGKSLIALNLARAAGRTAGTRVLLIDADLRQPSLHRMIDRNGVAGLAQLLSHGREIDAGLRELVVTVERMRDEERPAPVDVLLAGSTPPNPAELLDSARMQEVLDAAAAMYDLVIIDTPPIGVVSDAIPLVHQVDGLLVINRIEVSRRDHALALMKRLRSLDAHVLGVVVNSFRGHPESAYGYRDYASGEDGEGAGGARRLVRGVGRGR